MAGYNFSANPIDAAPPAAPAQPKAASPPPAGPTNFWGRIAQVGIGKVNALNAYRAVSNSGPAVNSNNNPLKTAAKDTGKVTNAVGKFLFKGTAKLANQGLQEGKQVVDTAKMEAASHTNNPTAFSNANKQSQQDYKGFNKNKGGLFNAGTATSEAEAKKGDLKTGVKDIGGATLESAGELIPLAKFGEAAKVYKLGEGVVEASHGAMRQIAENTVLGALSGAAGNTGANLLQNGKIDLKNTAKGALTGGIIGGGSTALAKGFGVLHGVFKDGPVAAIQKMTGKTGAMSGDLPKAGMTDVLSEKAASEASNAGKITVKGAEDTGTSIHVATPVKMSNDEYAQRFNALSKSYDKAYKGLEKMPSGKQKIMATAIDNQHVQALEQLNKDYIHGTLPGKAVTNAGQKLMQNKATGVIEKTAGKTSQKAPAQAAEVAAPTETASLSQKVSRPAGEKAPPEPLVNTNKAPSTGITSKLQSKGAGTLNPELGAARQGNTDFASTIRQIASGDVHANFHANSTADKFAGLYNDYIKQGGSHANFIKDVESGKLGTQAHDFWTNHFKEMGSQLESAGILKNGARDASYVPRIAKFSEKGGGSSMGGLRKTGGFAKGRAQLESGTLGEPGSDLYKTHGEYKAAVESQGGKVADNPVEIMRQSTATRLKAINHAEGLAQLDKTAMRDGRAATITFSQDHGLPPGYRDYNTSLIPGRAVHPEAVKGVEALVKTPGGNEIERSLSKYNSTAKRLVTLNGLVHGKNFALASIREQGLRGTATAFKNYAEQDVNRAIEHGFVPSRAGMTNIFDEANNGKGALGKSTSVLGKLYDKSQKALFEGFGDKLGMNTYLHVEKNLLKQGLSQDEAGKIAADTANRVIFSQRATETSAALKEASRVAFFAGKFFQSTMAIGTKITGAGKNNILSDAAQKAEQRQAAKAFARGFTYLFGAAQAMNYATTGHSTFQNKDSKLSPVFYVDKKTGKEYHITNFYGQIGELLNIANPKTVINKLSPGAQELSRIISNTDPYKGTQVRDKNASGPRQLVQVFMNALENAATPLGFQTSTLNQTFGKGAQPGTVSGAKLLGYGTSTKDQNRLEKEVDAKYSATLPQGHGASQDASLMKAEAAARQDIKQGKTDSPALKQVKSSMSDAAYKKFVKGGAVSDTQRHFDSLPTEQKLQLIDKYSPEQLKELDLSGVAKSLVSSSAKTSVQSLESKGYTPEKIQQLLQKAGYNPSQLQQIKLEAKRQQSQAERQGRYQPKWQNPLLK
jgi:hypothetical protein